MADLPLQRLITNSSGLAPSTTDVNNETYIFGFPSLAVNFGQLKHTTSGKQRCVPWHRDLIRARVGMGWHPCGNNQQIHQHYKTWHGADCEPWPRTSSCRISQFKKCNKQATKQQLCIPKNKIKLPTYQQVLHNHQTINSFFTLGMWANSTSTLRTTEGCMRNHNQ